MKFLRFGSLSLQKQNQYEEPTTDMWPSSPPCKKGFFAFPAGYSDPFYLPLTRPPENPHSLLQYIRNDNGEKMTRADLYCGLKYDYTLSEDGKAFLKKHRLRESQIMWLNRPMYVMYCKDSNDYPQFFGLGTDAEDHTRLNQPVEFLLDPDGVKISARDFFNCDFYEWKCRDYYKGIYSLHSPKPDEDFQMDDYFYCSDKKKIKYGKWLKTKGVSPEQLCIWPVFENMEDEYACKLKRYRVFDYEGCLWHHLGAFLKRSEILSQFSYTWFYTDIHAYERALKKADGRAFWKRHKYRLQLNNNGYHGYFSPYYWNATFDPSGMFEVFFDQRIP